MPLLTDLRIALCFSVPEKVAISEQFLSFTYMDSIYKSTPFLVVCALSLVPAIQIIYGFIAFCEFMCIISGLPKKEKKLNKCYI